ncbi:MAG: porin [Chitinophagaceae bacterium]
MVNRILRGVILLAVALLMSIQGFSQRYLAELDSSLFIKDTVRPFLRRFENLRFTGYIQPQFQVAESKGAKSFEGGDFSQFSSSRFMLRRARIKLDYFITDAKNKWARALFSFQIDATERGVNVRDMFVRIYDSKVHLFSLTTGLFARPFGYEVNLSSAFRETPERGRMSQILMPTERDLGAMISFEPQNRNQKLGFLKIDVGFFNGQGLSGTTEFDSHKDLISRVAIKPIKITRWELSSGLSLLLGGWRQATKYVYDVKEDAGGTSVFDVDSSLSNVGKISPRHYYGADIQIKLNHAWGATEWRAEYWMGKQSGTLVSSSNPGTLPLVPIYRRDFNGGFFYFLQNIVNAKHQLLLKYDWYDPNTKVEEKEIGSNGTNFSATDISYATIGIGYAHYYNDHIKFVLYYEIVKNKATALSGYTTDLKDNILTCRMQFRF